MKSNLRQKSLSFILHPSSFIFAFCAFALAPLTAPGYFIYAHDARHSVYFLQMFDATLRDGAWYPRWAADMTFGYGYPLWLILAPLPFFVGEAFHLVGFDFVSAVKLVDGLAVFCSALTMYLFASRVLGKNAGLVAAIAYVYIPYHLVDLYVRAAQAELTAFVFPPLICWAFYQLATTRQPRYIATAALAYALLILSHISMALLFAPIIGLYILFVALTESRRHDTVGRNWFQRTASCLLPPAFSILLAFGIAAIFLLPVLFEQRYLTSDPLISGFFNYRKHFLNANQLLSPFWGYGYAGENGADQFSLQLGLIPTLLAIIAVGASAKTRDASRAHIAFFAAMVGAMVFAMLPISAPMWEPFAAVIGFVQFPWRLLIITAFALAFLSGAALHAFADDARDRAPALAVGLIFVVANYAYTQPQHTDAVFNYQTQMEFETKYGELLGDTIWMTGDRPKDSPLVAQYIAGEKLHKAIALDEGATVETLRYG
ncbi:MAG: glycosyltransferase family 39 protein, partial [Chloroflexota bacterium]